MKTVGFDENWDIDKAVQEAKTAGHDGLIVRFVNADLRNNSYPLCLLQKNQLRKRGAEGKEKGGGSDAASQKPDRQVAFRQLTNETVMVK